jgi:hypothetical protein
MSSPRRHALLTAVGRSLLAVVLVSSSLAACGSDGDTTNSQTAAQRGDDGEAPDEASSGETSTSISTGDTTTTAPSDTSTSTTAGEQTTPGDHGDNVGGTQSKPPADPPEPAAVGTYTYRQSGFTGSGSKQDAAAKTGTLTVEASNGGQKFSRKYETNEPPEDTYLSFDNGAYLTRVVIRAGVGGQALEFSCKFDKPFPWPPWPATDGARAAAKGDCGSFSATVEGAITGSRRVAIDGEERIAIVFASKMTLSGSATGTIEQEDWIDHELTLALHSSRKTQITYGFSKYHGDVTSDLLSARPT